MNLAYPGNEIARRCEEGNFFGEDGAITIAKRVRDAKVRLLGKYNGSRPAISWGGETVSSHVEEVVVTRLAANIAYASVLYSAAGNQAARAAGLAWGQYPLHKLWFLVRAVYCLSRASWAVGSVDAVRMSHLNSGQLHILASIYFRIHQPSRASVCCAEILSREDSPPNDKVLAVKTLAEIGVARGNLAGARDALSQAYAEAEQCDPMTQSRFFRTVGEVEAALGNEDAAARAYAKALDAAMCASGLEDQKVKAKAHLDRL